ncbi:inactive lysozyme 1A-like [Lucilia cuprina]|uniref:inactive lysozyme 1A-like n=1 Tax=Lucilia cuprina TaxID=7375 RepID=UPI001F06763B|nr:inactive lysozyme 1A-like [Lucilia cuprina]
MKYIIIILAAVASFVPTFAITYNRCSLAKAMYNLGIPKDQLNRLTCIAEHVSSYRTDLVGPTKSDAFSDYGIFQINNYSWCQSSDGHFSQNQCNVICDDLLSDNIRASLNCARKILSQEGLSAWF